MAGIGLSEMTIVFVLTLVAITIIISNIASDAVAAIIGFSICFLIATLGFGITEIVKAIEQK